MEAGTQLDVSASTYGYYYEHLINHTLIASGLSLQDINLVRDYLSHLAFSMLQSGSTRRLSDGRLRQFHAHYEDERAIEIAYSAHINRLMDRQLLDFSNGSFGFRHGYIYYYFLAKHLSERVNDPSVLATIREMSTQLWRSDNANVMQFLAYLSTDNSISRILIDSADAMFADLAPAALSRDESHRLLPSGVPAEEFVDEDFNRQRSIEVEKIDRSEPPSDDEMLLAPDEHPVDIIAQVNAAFKTIQIAGQVLKSSPSALAQHKLQLATSIHNLGLRTLSLIATVMTDNKDELLKDLALILRELRPEYDGRQLVMQASRTYEALARGNAFGVVRLLAVALGSRDTTITCARLEDEFPTEATKLVVAAVAIDNEDVFPERKLAKLVGELRGNSLAEGVLRDLAVRHFRLFPLGFDIKQRTCKLLNVNYKRVQMLNPALRLTKKSG